MNSGTPERINPWDKPRWDDPVWRFTIWYIEPIAKLKELYIGSGAFAAFIIALPWYERLIVARLKLKVGSFNKDDVRDEIGRDLNLTDGERRIFWDTFRNGLLHEGMPKAGKTKFVLEHSYSGYPEFKTASDGTSVICINPWKFADRIAEEFLADPNLITTSDSFPLANVSFVAPDTLP